MHNNSLKKTNPLLGDICFGKNRKSQLLFILDGILVNSAIVLTIGVFLSGYIVFLNGSDSLVGILNNSITWAAVGAVFSFVIYEKMKYRKKLLITFCALSRLLVCSIVFLPLFIHGNSLLLAVASVMVVAGNLLWGFYAVGATVWMISLIPDESRGRYNGVRMLSLRIAFTLVTIGAGFILDLFHKSYAGFLIVFSFSLVLSIVDIVTLMNIRERPNKVADAGGFHTAAFLSPLKNRSFRQLGLFMFFFYFSMTISTSFTPLYLVKYLNINYGAVSISSVMQSMALILFTRLWSGLENKKGAFAVLRISSVFIAIELLIDVFLRTDTSWLIYIAPAISGIGYSGFNVSILTYRYQIIPRDNRTVYESWFGAILGLSTLLSPVFGSLLLKLIPDIHNGFFAYGNFQLRYLLSFLMTVLVIYLMFYRRKSPVSAGETSIDPAASHEQIS